MVQLNAHEDVNICNEFNFVFTQVTQVLWLAFHLNDKSMEHKCYSNFANK